MAKENTNVDPVEDPKLNGDDPKGDDPKGNDPDPKGDDGIQLTDEQLKEAFKHPEFKKLREAKKQLDTLMEQQKEAENKKLEEEGKYQDLLEQERQEKATLKSQLELMKKTQAITGIAVTKGVRDVDAVVKLLDLSKIEINEDGEVQGVEDAVSELLEQKTYLLGEQPPENIGAGSEPNKANSGAIWQYDQLREKMQDRTWYEANREEVDKAFAEGRVIMGNK